MTARARQRVLHHRPRRRSLHRASGSKTHRTFSSGRSRQTPQFRQSAIAVQPQHNRPPMNETRTHAFKIIGFEEPVLQYGDPECPLFSAVEICRTLGIRNFNCAINRLDADSRFEITLTDANGKPERLTLINMAGVYDLALSNNTPKAEKFQQWVFREVLPSIRKTGSYDISSRRRENEYQQQLLELPSDWTRLVPTSTVVELFAVWGADYMSTQASSLGTQIVDCISSVPIGQSFPLNSVTAISSAPTPQTNSLTTSP
jgi:prophage antirepressor-like protein